MKVDSSDSDGSGSENGNRQKGKRKKFKSSGKRNYKNGQLCYYIESVLILTKLMVK